MSSSNLCTSRITATASCTHDLACHNLFLYAINTTALVRLHSVGSQLEASPDFIHAQT